METEKDLIERRFRRTDRLTVRKLLEYIPQLLVTNMSVFMLSTVDGLVAGNLLSQEALASVQIFLPGAFVLNVISTLISSGAGTSLSTCMGTNDVEAIRRTKSAIRWVMFLGVLLMAILQFPIMYALMASYGLTPELRSLTWQYAAGMMVAMPLGLISSVGSYQLLIIGKTKGLMFLSLGEGVANLLMDLFFVQVAQLGVVGIGLGTACANVLRCSATLVYLGRETDLFRRGQPKARWAEIKDILSCGLPDTANSLMISVQNYFMMRIILKAFGDGGGVIKGVCFFAYSIITFVIQGIQGGMRPLMGLFAGTGDTKAFRFLISRCVSTSLASTGVLVLLMELFPGFIYSLNGVKAVPEGGALSLRLYLPYTIILGIDALFRLYFSNRKDTRFATALTIIGNATLPVFALLLFRVLPAPYLWLSFLLSELLICSINLFRYFWWVRQDREAHDPSEQVLFLTVKPEEAIEASRMLRQFADENGSPPRVAYRMALCMEEMVAYAVESQKNQAVQIQIMARFTRDGGRFIMLDDGRCIALDENEETKALITDNYGLLKKVAKSVEYQYILNLNHTVISF